MSKHLDHSKRNAFFIVYRSQLVGMQLRKNKSVELIRLKLLITTTAFWQSLKEQPAESYELLTQRKSNHDRLHKISPVKAHASPVACPAQAPPCVATTMQPQILFPGQQESETECETE